MPIAATSVFYAGIKWGWADGHLVWFILTAMGIGGNVLCRYIPEKAAGNVVKKGRREGGEEQGGREEGER